MDAELRWVSRMVVRLICMDMMHMKKILMRVTSALSLIAALASYGIAYAQSTTMPGVPSTGAGGNAPLYLAVLVGSLLIASGAIRYLRQTPKER